MNCCTSWLTQRRALQRADVYGSHPTPAAFTAPHSNAMAAEQKCEALSLWCNPRRRHKKLQSYLPDAASKRAAAKPPEIADKPAATTATSQDGQVRRYAHFWHSPLGRRALLLQPVPATAFPWQQRR